jgi:Holliday junction resolvase
MLEKTFRSELVKELNKVGFYAMPIESAVTPGFPDVVVAGHSIAMIELKVVKTMSSKKLLSSLFEKNQLAFYKRWWKTTANNLWCAVYIENEKEICIFRLNPYHLMHSLSSIEVFCLCQQSSMKIIVGWLKNQI